MATRKPGTSARPGGGTQSRDKGTRGGRPEASTTAGPRQGNRPGGRRAGNGRPASPRTAAPVKAAVQEAQPVAPPLWYQLTTWILSLAGLGVSIYLTIAHFNT